MLMVISDALLSNRLHTETRRSAAGDQAAAWRGLALALALLLAVAAPSAANGAYFPTSWGWMSLAFAWVGLLALLLRRIVALNRLDYALLGGLLALGAWTAASALWSSDVTQTMLETERTTAYVLGVAAVLLVVSRRRLPQLLAGVTCGITVVCAYGLATRLFPERLGGVDDLALNRLARPVGYWNAFGMFAAMGVLLALPFAARARSTAARAAAAASLALTVPTLYFTFGRGAWAALGAGLVAMLALDRRRLQLLTAILVATPAPALVVLLASRSHALTSNTPAVSAASRDGHRLALVILVAVMCSAVAATLLRVGERRFHPPRSARLVYAGAFWLVVLVALGATIARYGAPWTIAGNAYDQFAHTQGTGTSGKGANLNRRLFTLAGNGRVGMWKVAWHDAQEHRWLGSGAGTFEQYWLRHRTIPNKVRDAHSLYLETLAELGPVGLLALVLLLVAPFAGLARARQHPLAAGAFGAYIAYLLHAAADWDWEVAGVTMTAFFCACALVIAARDTDASAAFGAPARALWGLIVAAAGVFAVVGLIANSALSASSQATNQERWGKADAQARKAISWAPWSADGWRLLGESELQQTRFTAARASFEKAIAKDRGDWNLWLDLALASSGRARRVAALHALRLNPRSPEIAQIRPALGLSRRQGASSARS